MKFYSMITFYLWFILKSKVANVTADTLHIYIKKAETGPKSDVLNDLQKYCSKPNTFCDSAQLLNPLKDLIINQTKIGSKDCKHQDGLIRAMKRFLKPITLNAILGGDPYALNALLKNFANIANDGFSDTGMNREMFKTFQEVQRRITPKHIKDFLSGESTEPLLEIFQASIHMGFKGHPDLQAMLDQSVDFQCWFNRGRGARKEEMQKLLKNDDLCFLKERNECKENGGFFNYKKGKDCPSGFIYNTSVCYKVVTSPPLSYNEARSVPTDPSGSRLVKIRDQGAWNYLTSQMTQAGITDMWVGLRNVGVDAKSPSDWRWEDGTGLAVPDPTGLIQWHPHQPDSNPEECLYMAPPKYCWSDYNCHYLEKMPKVLQSEAVKATCPAKWLLHAPTQTCYTVDVATDGKAAALRTPDQWHFVVGLINESHKAQQLIKIGGELEDGKWPFPEFGQWCQGEPDNKKESYAEIANWEAFKMNDLHLYAKQPYAKEWIASSCSEWQHLGHKKSGIYRILPRGTTVDVQVRCDMANEGGGWTVIQSRRGQTSFGKDMSEYINGFGVLTSDFWLGLEKISHLTSQDEVSLLISLTDNSGLVQHFVYYKKFRLRNNESDYRFCIENSDTQAIDDMAVDFSNQQNVPFVVDPQKGGWWFTKDSAVNLNGKFPTGPLGKEKSALMQWSPDLIVTKTEMKVKSIYFFKCV